MLFADISRQQHPHHFNSSLYSPQQYLSSPNSEQLFLNDIQNSFKKSNVQYNTNDQQILQKQTQFNVPLQSQRTVQEKGQTVKVAVSQPFRSEMGEHMLRRKTPNGTLSAGYDGTPVEWGSRPHIDKHFLMPAADAVRYTNQGPFSGPTSATERSSSLNLADNISNLSWQTQILSTPIQQGFPTGNDTSVPAQIWLQSKNRPPSLDSMLYQMPQIPMNSLNAGMYHQVPTVLQPMWPPSLGLTASNAQGRYGPYWPDGSFIPYRPAALRDSHLQTQFANFNLGGHIDSHPRQQLMSQDSSVMNFKEPDFSTWSTSILQDENPHATTGMTPASAANLDVNGGNARHMSDPQPAPSFAHRARALSTRPVPTPRQQTIQPLWPLTANPFMQVPSPTSSSNPQFKTRVLIWAHRIYVNLSLHARQRNPNHASNKHHPIYPRLTRRSYSSPQDGPTPQIHSTQHGSDYARKQSIDQTTNEISRPNDSSNSAKWDQAQQRSMFHEKHDRGLRLNQPVLQQQMRQVVADYRQSPNFASSSAPLASTAFVSPQTATMEAQHAMKILDTLCSESNWQWVDGILLGGCLAYALEQFDAALQWYERVLACDPNNVEAISNTAAAFLSLKRRKEAEQYWYKAVRLRPSYFEAVEHLVGLLCGDQRGREAVKVIEIVENALRLPVEAQRQIPWEHIEERGTTITDQATFSADKGLMGLSLSSDAGSGYRIPSSDNGRMIALIHAKGNMLYALGDNNGAAKAFEDAIMIVAGRRSEGIAGLIQHILKVFASFVLSHRKDQNVPLAPYEAILLAPEIARMTKNMVFPSTGQLPGLRAVPEGQSYKAAISVASNSLLSLAKIYQDGMSSSGSGAQVSKSAPGVQDILALYYLSLSLQPSPSTANNVGILLASVQQTIPQQKHRTDPKESLPGVVPGSGIALALSYYNYGLKIDAKHAHLYTNLGSLLKDIGQLNAAIKMYEKAVDCDGNFDIALANLANAVKDQGRISDAIGYYQRAVKSSPDFAEAVCGLANALNSVCNWKGRGGVVFAGKKYDQWHVDEEGMLIDARDLGVATSGWIGRVVSIVEKQLRDGKSWGKGVLQSKDINSLLSRTNLVGDLVVDQKTQAAVIEAASSWSGREWEGAKVVRLVERATRRLGWKMYQEKYVLRSHSPPTYARPQLPLALTVPSAPTVLPFHTFTCPLTANQIRKISQRNGLRISCSTLKAPWLPNVIFEPPPPPQPYLNVGYVSSDFNNHPLAHLMQSVFGLHNPQRVRAICYATTASDNSSHRAQIEQEAPLFRDVSSWSVDKLVKQIVNDNVHILVNLNGYTRGARNEVFAARPAPIQMSFMGFAGTLGAEWCDYLLADRIAVPPSMLRPWRGNVNLIDQIKDNNYSDDDSDWVYGENIIFAKETFFCCDHRQSAPDAKEPQLSWTDEQQRRKKMRKELFPNLPDDVIILGNFNQLYKVRTRL